MDRAIVLAGSSVALVQMTSEDQPFFQKWISESEELRSLIDDQSIPTMEDQMRWFARVQEPDRCMFSLVTVPDGTLIGNAGFVSINHADHSAQLRITIGNPHARGKGLGTEAVGLLLKYAFTHMNIERVHLEVLPHNTAAVRVYEKHGFVISPTPGEKGRILMQLKKP